jgi:geranylgeranyl pyrophosphate synthase
MSETSALPLSQPIFARGTRFVSRPSDGGRDATLDGDRTAIEARLAAIALQDGGSGRLCEAMRYCLLAPGKRLRPLMCVLAARGLEGDELAALDAACAIEMVHTASLVLDDLPAMDDATLRRGRPCTHEVFGEGTAILAAIALLNRAFAVLAGLRGVDDAVRNGLVRELAQAAGAGGLSSGQQLDLTDRIACSSVRDVDAMNHLKTGVLFVAAARAGGLIGGAGPDAVDGLSRYALHFGRAFQTADDILDMVVSREDAGKDTGKDASRPSVATLAGIDEARRRIARDIEEARQALAGCSLHETPLALLLDGLCASLPS